jgi:hypothetical protein
VKDYLITRSARGESVRLCLAVVGSDSVCVPALQALGRVRAEARPRSLEARCTEFPYVADWRLIGGGTAGCGRSQNLATPLLLEVHLVQQSQIAGVGA